MQAELHRRTRDDIAFDPGLRRFLSFAYNLKAIADYETGPEAEVSPREATDAVANAKRFVAHFVAVLTAP